MNLTKIDALFLVALLLAAPSRAQVTQRVSVSDLPQGGNAASYDASTSTDGRFVAYESDASNLVDGGTNGFRHIFVRDRVLGTTKQVSLSSSGVQGNDNSYRPVISADGRFVAFFSDATNLVPGDTNGSRDVFLRDCQTAMTERVSVGGGGIQGNGDSGYPSISPDGRYVAFESWASNLVAVDVGGWPDIFVRDRQLATTTIASVDSLGAQGGGVSYNASISADGRYVAFNSEATLVPSDTNGYSDIYVRDLQAHTTERVSVDSSGAQANDASLHPSISADGRFVAYYSSATNLVAGDTNGTTDIFVRDRQLNSTQRVSVDSSGAEGNSDCYRPAISSDGRYVAFQSGSSNLVAGDSNGTYDVFVRDRQAGTTERVSVDSGGIEGNGYSDGPAISSDCRYVAFESESSNLVAGDGNAVRDIFIRDRQSNTTVRASVHSGGAEVHLDSFRPSISADGRFIAFESSDAGFVAADTNGAKDVFVRDRQLGTTERVSVDSAGAQGNGNSFYSAISADGRYVAFESDTTNLVPGDTNGVSDVFVHDRQTGTTERVSVDPAGVQGNGESGTDGVSISADGRYVAFDSGASNLVPGDTNGSYDIFVRDRVSGTTERVSVDPAGVQGNGNSYYPAISADGRYVAFISLANLAPGDTNGTWDVFVRDRQTGTTELASVDSAGAQGNEGVGGNFGPSISTDCRYVAFYSSSNNLVSGDMNGTWDVFVRDRQTGTTELASLDSAGAQGNGFSGTQSISISADGRYVAFNSLATNLVAGDTNGKVDIFVRDRQTGTTERVSVDSAGVEGNSYSDYTAISADGRYVALESLASNLVSGDTNGAYDIFVRDRNAAGLTSMCEPGESGVIPCPCRNPPSGPGRGCDNSSATGGASLAASGIAYLSMDSLVFTTNGEKPAAVSVLLQGTTVVSSGVVYGRGVRCIASALTPLYTKTATGGSITAPDFSAGDPTVSARSAALGDMIQPGQSRWYFVIYRDPLGACPRSSQPIASGIHTFNVTQTGRIDWSL